MTYGECMKKLLEVDVEHLLAVNKANKRDKTKCIELYENSIRLHTDLEGGFEISFSDEYHSFDAIFDPIWDTFWHSYCSYNVSMLDIVDLILNHNAYVKPVGIIENIFSIIKNKYFIENFNKMSTAYTVDSVVEIMQEAEDIERSNIIKIMDVNVDKLMQSIGEKVYEYGYNMRDYRYYNIRINGKRDWYTYREIKEMFNIEDEYDDQSWFNILYTWY